jgi:YihY family inner membrane protein
MFPLILGMLSILGLVVHDTATEDRVRSLILGVFPSDAHAQLGSALNSVKHSSGVLGAVAIAGLVWSGTSLFAGMEFALTQIFGSRQRDMVRQRAMGAMMLLVFLAAILITVGANSVAGAVPILSVGSFVVGTGAMVGLLIAIYRFVPNTTFTLAEIWPGALLAGVLIEVFTFAFPIYARLTHGFNSYGQQFALFFLLATWLVFLSQFILLGAVFNRMRAGEPGEVGLLGVDTRGRPAPRPDEAIQEQAPQSSPAQVQ